MALVRVVTDSASDLAPELAARRGIHVVPLTIRFGAEEFVDQIDLTPAEFWARSSTSSTLPQTAAPAPGTFEVAFRQAAAEGASGVVCVTLSAALSATFGSAEIAARALEGTVEVRVVDSKSASMGQGMMALACAEAAAAGKGLDDVAAVAIDLIPRTRVYAALDTLENLVKGGRVGRAQGMIGSMLAFKPVIAVRDGEVVDVAKPRTRTRSLQHLVDRVSESAPVENVAVMHGDASDVDHFIDLLGEVHPRNSIAVGQIGAIIGTHGGPRVMAVMFHASP